METENNNKPIVINEPHVRNTVKGALENMYMFGGMGRPNPDYDRYMNNMIEMVMNSINPNKK